MAWLDLASAYDGGVLVRAEVHDVSAQVVRVTCDNSTGQVVRVTLHRPNTTPHVVTFDPGSGREATIPPGLVTLDTTSGPRLSSPILISMDEAA